MWRKAEGGNTVRAEEFIQGLTEDTISELDTRTLVQYVPKAGRTLAGLPPKKRKNRSGWMTRAYQKLIPRPDFSAEIEKYHAEKGEGKGMAEGLMWYDTDERLSVDDRMAIIESYYLSKSQTLTESNDKAMSDYFVSLTSMSDKPTKNGKFLMVFLALLNNKVHQLLYPEIVTILAKQGNEYTVELEDGTTKKIPSKNIRDKLVAATFFFNNDKAFDKFRTIMSLKFDMDFAEYSEYVPEQGVAEGSEDALKFATKAHAGQTRADGDPYITHPMRVADSIKQYKKSHNLDHLISAALLHDTVEDTDTTHEALHDLFGGLVASLVKELTSDPEKIKQMGKTEYLAQKMAAMSSYALVIKLADRLDNVKDIATAKTPEWRAKYKKETEHILDYIESNRVLSGTHKKLIGLIRDKLGEIDSQQKGVEGSLDEACWKGYHKEGNKKMFGKTYPNCVKNKKKKTNEEQGEKCPHCGGPIFTEMQIAEEKDACYRKVKSRYKIWPSAYASGALVRCRKVGAKNWGNKGKK